MIAHRGGCQLPLNKIRDERSDVKIGMPEVRFEMRTYYLAHNNYCWLISDLGGVGVQSSS